MTAFVVYFRERLPLPVFGPLAVLLTTAAAWSAANIATAQLVVTALFGIALLIQFRLWDDLEDRERDRVTHPTRVLVNVSEIPFRVLVFVLAVFAAGLSARRPAAFIGTLMLNAVFWCAYRTLHQRLSPAAWSYGVLLLKYPAFVVLMALSLGDVMPVRLAAAALTAYVCASGYELLHDIPAGAGGAS